MPWKQKYVTESSRFYVCLCPLCWKSDSKIVLSHAHWWVISNGHSLEIIFSLVMSSPGGLRMVNVPPECNAA